MPSPEGCVAAITHDAPSGCVRLLGDLSSPLAAQLVGEQGWQGGCREMSHSRVRLEPQLIGRRSGTVRGCRGLPVTWVCLTRRVQLWRAVAAARGRFAAANVAVAAPPKHAR